MAEESRFIPLKKSDDLTGLADVQIIRRVLGGETQLFELLMRRYNRKLFRIARSILKNAADAEDALQEAYVRAYTHLRDFKGQAGVGAWLARVVINESLARLRHRRRGPISSDIEAADSTQLTESVAPLTLGSSLQMSRNSAEVAYRYDLLRLLEAAIDTLPEHYGLVFTLRAIEQLSVEETAEYLNINPATVKTRYHRARTLLQKRLRQQFEELTTDAFAFGGQHCDRIVIRVLNRVLKPPPH